MDLSSIHELSIVLTLPLQNMPEHQQTNWKTLHMMSPKQPTEEYIYIFKYILFNNDI